MDSGAAPCDFCCLGILSPSMSPPPLGERTRQSRQTTSHLDSHTMGDHKDEIPEMSSPPHEVGDEYPTPIYDPSLEIHSHSSYDPSFTGHWYWFPGDETHCEPTSTINVRYDIPDILKSNPTYHVELEVDHAGTTLGGTPTLFHAKRFGGTSHIAPSIPVVEASSHAPPRPSASYPIQILGPR